MADNANPSDEEYQAAQMTIARRNAAIAAERDAKFKPLRDLLGSDCFAEFNAALAALPDELVVLPEVAPMVNAIRTGLNGMARILPAPLAPIA